VSGREPVLTRQNAIIADALKDGWGDVPTYRLSRLYGQAYGAWLRGNRETFDRLRPLLADLITRREELTPEQDAALRAQYRLEAK